jgi:PST family polysaccharide transporter
MGIINKLKSAEIVHVSFYSGVSTVIKIITSFVSAKVIAIYLGPTGLGMLGQLTSFIAIFLTLSTGAITTGVIKFVSEYKNEEQLQHRLIKSALQITLFCSLISAFVISLGSSYWSKILFGNSSYAYVFVILGITVVFYAIFSLAISVLNGMQQYKLFNIINVLASVVGLIFSLTISIYKTPVVALLSTT